MTAISSKPPEYTHVAPDEANILVAGHIIEGEKDERTLKHHKRAAGIVSGLAGSMMLGPILGIVLGLLTSNGTEKKGVWGDIARSIGDVGIVIRDKLKDLNRRHDFI
eukprot:scaffold38427_cov52-Attheya_sp.AAC.2